MPPLAPTNNTVGNLDLFTEGASFRTGVTPHWPAFPVAPTQNFSLAGEGYAKEGSGYVLPGTLIVKIRSGEGAGKWRPADKSRGDRLDADADADCMAVAVATHGQCEAGSCVKTAGGRLLATYGGCVKGGAIFAGGFTEREISAAMPRLDINRATVC